MDIGKIGGEVINHEKPQIIQEKRDKFIGKKMEDSRS